MDKNTELIPTVKFYGNKSCNNAVVQMKFNGIATRQLESNGTWYLTPMVGTDYILLKVGRTGKYKITRYRYTASATSGNLRMLGLNDKKFRLYPHDAGWVIIRNKPICEVENGIETKI